MSPIVAVASAVTTGSAYVDSTVSPSTTYSYTVQAYDAAGNISAASAAAPVTTPAKVDTQAPTVPTALVSSNVTATAATISWAAVRPAPSPRWNCSGARRRA